MVGQSSARGVLAVCAATLALATSALGDEPLSRSERTKLQQQAKEKSEQIAQQYNSGNLPQAVQLARETLEIWERLYPAKDYPDGHLDLARSLNNVGGFLQALGEPAKALPYHEKALAMCERLYPPDNFKDDHGERARSLSNLGIVLRELRQPAKALPHYEKALAMCERLYPPDK